MIGASLTALLDRMALVYMLARDSFDQVIVLQILRFDSNTMRIHMLLKTIYNTKYHKSILSSKGKGKNVYYEGVKDNTLDMVVDVAKMDLMSR